MISRFHAGERAVQTRAGVQSDADQVGRIVGNALAPAVQAFLRFQRLAVVASVGAGGDAWASPLTGRPGFLRALDPRTVQIDAPIVPGDPLANNLAIGAQLGLLVIDLERRGRIRINGLAAPQPDGTLRLQIAEAFGNCPKYIHVRVVDDSRSDGEAGDGSPAGARAAMNGSLDASGARATSLTDEQQRVIAAADTFFIASRHPERGADASHRGGPTGFVQVLDRRRLRFPDYAGNHMFQTLGNLAVDPHVGLLFVDFERGRTLQLTGRAEVIWNAAEIERMPGAERLVDVEVTALVELKRPGLPYWRRVASSE